MELLPAPGQSTFSGAGGGVGSAVVGEGLTTVELRLGVAVACAGLGDAARAAIEPGEAPTLHALTTTINAARQARRLKPEPA
jgi:hypothetical protein